MPRVPVLTLNLPEDLFRELDGISMKSGMLVEETASFVLETALVGSRRVVVAPPPPHPSEATEETFPLTVPATRRLYHHLLKRSRLSRQPMEELAVRMLQRTDAKAKALAPAMNAMRQLYEARLAEVEQKQNRTFGQSLEVEPAPAVVVIGGTL